MTTRYAPDSYETETRPSSAWRSWLVQHRISLILLCGATLAVGAAMGWNLEGYPGRANDDEGTYVVRAWAMLYEHHFSYYTYFWDHPFFGWAQIAAWARLTDGFALASRAVMVGREFMLAITLVSCGLMYLLARRLNMGRAFAICAVLLFGLSPIGIWYHRMVSLDNIATVWALAAFVAAASWKRSLGAVVLSAICFAAATWSKETIMLLLPALLWLIGQQTAKQYRKKYLLVFMVVCFGIVSLYPLLAVVKGELLSGRGHVSLFGEIVFQLASRQGTGSLMNIHSGTFAQARTWVELDPWLTLGGPVAVVAGLAIRRLRAIAIALALLIAYLAKGGYVPYAYVTAMLPFAALLISGILDHLWQDRTAGRTGQILVRSSVVLIGVVFLITGVPRWTESLRAQAHVNQFAAEDEAVDWVAKNVPAGDIVVCDDYPMLDIQLHTRATPLYLWQIDDDPGVMHNLLPRGYKDISYLVLEPSSPLTFAALPGRPTLNAAIAHSVIVKRFGKIYIYKVRSYRKLLMLRR